MNSIAHRDSLVLIVDDEKSICDLISDVLTHQGFKCITAHDGQSALHLFRTSKPDVVLLDVWLQGSEMDGIGVLELMSAMDFPAKYIVMSGHGTIDIAIKSVKLGAYDYIEKPLTSARLTLAVQRALDALKLDSQISILRQKEICDWDRIVGNSDALAQLRRAISSYTPKAPVCIIQGSIGSQRASIARLLHKSVQFDRIVYLDRSVLAGAHNEVEGFVDGLSCRTSVFARQIGDLSMHEQIELARLIKLSTKKLDPREIQFFLSSDRSVPALAESRSIDLALYSIIKSATHLCVPPLSSRTEDVSDLARYISNGLVVSDEAIAALKQCSWPGDVRQFKNCIEGAAMMASLRNSQVIEMCDLDRLNHNSFMTTVSAMPIKEARELFESEYLALQMKAFKGNISRIAQFIGMDRTALHRKLKALGVGDAR